MISRLPASLVRPEVSAVAQVLQDDLVAVRQVRQEVACGPLRRCCEVQVAADQERLDLRVAHPRVVVLVRRRRPRVDQLAAGPDEVGAGCADDGSAVGAVREEAAGVRASILPPLQRRPRAARSGTRPEPSATGATHRLRHRRRRRGACRSSTARQAAPAVGGRLHQAEERGRLDVAVPDGQEPPALRNVSNAEWSEAARSRRTAPAGRSSAQSAA